MGDTYLGFIILKFESLYVVLANPLGFAFNKRRTQVPQSFWELHLFFATAANVFSFSILAGNGIAAFPRVSSCGSMIDDFSAKRRTTFSKDFSNP